tara:strand:- start:420 stop:614 length:195 start_codon:yes stop_codon:yes gene_type:complete
MTILKNICLEYTDDVVCEYNQIHAMINKKYAEDLQMKLEQKGCTLLSISKKYFLWLMTFHIPDF